MSIKKILIRSILFSFCFTILTVAIIQIQHLVYRENLFNAGYDDDLWTLINLNAISIIFLFAFIPLAIASLIFNFFVKDFISKFFYWFVGSIPIGFLAHYVYGAFFVGGINGLFIGLFLILYLVFAFYSNYLLILKNDKA